MRIIDARNVNDALVQGLTLLQEHGHVRGSRASQVRKLEEPVMTIYHRPWECCMLWTERRAPTPFLLMESLWMLAGRNDLAWIEQFLPSFKQFSDDGKKLYGAYGHRWRRHFLTDQLINMTKLLSNKPDTRRAVLAMYDPGTDSVSHEGIIDIPCNLNIVFNLRRIFEQPGFMALDMYITCRSNDIIWGAYGANAVHFAMLHNFVTQYVNRHISSNEIVKMGKYHQFSIDYHAYSDMFLKHYKVTGHRGDTNPYAKWKNTEQFCYLEDPDSFLSEVEDFVGNYPGPGEFATGTYNNSFLAKTAWPLRESFFMAKTGSLEKARRMASTIQAPDWLEAMVNWLQWREDMANERE